MRSEITRAGRRPACQWPNVGSRSIQMKSPRCGTYGWELPDFIADGRTPIHFAVTVLVGNAFDELFEGHAFADGPDLDFRVFVEVLARRNVRGYHNHQLAIAPNDLRSHP